MDQMGLTYPAEWKFEGVGFPLPQGAMSELLGILFKIDAGSQDVVEDFKAAFGGSSWSSSYDWATTDLARIVESSAENAAAFVDSFWKCLERAQTRGLPVPSAGFVNKILAKHGVPLVLEPPILRLAKDATIVVAAEPSPGAGQSGPVPMFVLKEEIGKGGFGTVYRATRTTAVDEFEYALKILDPSPFIADYDKAIKRFRREVSALRSLQHKSIVHYFEAGFTIENKPYVVMQLIRGADLRKATSSMNLDEVVRVFVEILSALHYAHENDVIHRDLKPSNVIVRSSDRQPIILDFGSAYILEQLDSKTLTTEAVGTIGYIPSEVLADPRVRSPLQDVYACGVLLYEAMARRRPDPAAYMPLRMLRPALGVLDPIISDAIASVNQRMTSAAEFADRLSAAQPAP
jgi:hypothetical protein